MEIPGKNGPEIEYRYSKGWFPQSIDSKHFKDHEKQNPAIFWPYKSRTLTAQNVKLGEFSLNQSQIQRLGKKEERHVWYDEADAAITASEETMSGYGFKPFVMRGEYLMSSTWSSGYAEEHIG